MGGGPPLPAAREATQEPPPQAPPLLYGDGDAAPCKNAGGDASLPSTTRRPCEEPPPGQHRKTDPVDACVGIVPQPPSRPQAGPGYSRASFLRGKTAESFSDSLTSLQKVTAENIGNVGRLHDLLLEHVPREHPEAEDARRTLTALATILAQGVGGVIVAVVEAQFSNRLRFHHLDDGHLTRCFAKVAKNLHDQRGSFLKLLGAFSAHGSSDRWQHEELVKLAEALPEAAESLAALEGNPKDGAFVMSYKGNVMGAAGHLKYTSERWQLLKANGKLAGTRHASSLALAEWFGTEGIFGAVFVRSDDGGVHAFLPRGDDLPPQVLHFDSLKPCTQEEMLELFRSRIIQHGKLMHKTRPGMIRPGVRGENVLTYVNGRVISNVTIEDDTSMVVRAPTVDQELYVLSKEKFEANWALPGEDIQDDSWHGLQLKSRGFLRYRPKPGMYKWVYEVTAEDVARLPTGCFVSSWGAQQPMKPGDYLAMPAPEERAKEVYLMPLDVLSSYSVCVVDAENKPQPSPMAEKESRHRTQEEMLGFFRSLIIEHGRVMCKVKPALIRPGKLGERVVTCVSGRVTSDVVVSDETSVVVRAPTTDNELYSLTKEKFLANYVMPGVELDDSTPTRRLLRSQGFKQYHPKPGVYRHVYQLTKEDLALIPTGQFLASWGAPQPVREGDYLAVPAPATEAKEVYLMPGNVVNLYSECTEGPDAHVGPMPQTALAEKVKLSGTAPIPVGKAEACGSSPAAGSSQRARALKMKKSGTFQKALQKVEAEHIRDRGKLHQLLTTQVPDDHPEAEHARKTYISVADVLAGGVGGVMIAVVDGRLSSTLRFHHLDDGHLTRVFMQVAKNLHEQNDAFLKLVSAFSAHGTSDRWQHEEVVGMAEELPEAAEFLAALEGNPKDGAFIMSYRGNVLGAAGHVKYTSERWQLLKSNGKLAGTRHASSLALAEWLGSEGYLGAVFVRSDDGGVHAFLPQGEELPPKVLHFESLQPCTQLEMLRLFRDRIMQHGKLMHKTRPGMIRPGKRGESVLTYVNGRIISNVKIEDDTSMVVRAPTVDQELYVLSREKFEANWALPGEDVEDNSWHGQQLKSRGFKKYKPKPGIYKWVYEVSAFDVGLLPTSCFVSSWGAQQPVKQGDFLAMPAPEERAKEVYLMPIDVLSSYSVCEGDGAPAQHPLGPDSAPLAQAVMLELFRAKIYEKGKLMSKVKPAMIRPGKLGERVVTCVSGRVTSDVVIKDETSMVVRAPTTQTEFYVLTKEKFEANWITPGAELDDANPKSRLLKSQGFKQYRPKPNLKRVYQLTAEDAKLVPSGSFLASWGVPQPVHEGDYLVLPTKLKNANEVYLMPADVIHDSYTDSSVVEIQNSACGHRTQQEMLELFRSRIIEKGRLMYKSTPGLARPGRLGERVATCVGGRVTSEVVVKDETSMVIRAPTMHRELYVLSREKFAKNWATEGEDLPTSSPVKRLLASQGFKKHLPKPGARKHVYRVLADDVQLLPTGYFRASWGALQPLAEGDCLVMPDVHKSAQEIYLMPADVLVCYSDCTEEASGTAKPSEEDPYASDDAE